MVSLLRLGWIFLFVALLPVGSFAAEKPAVAKTTTTPAPAPLPVGAEGAAPQALQPYFLAPAVVVPAALLWCTLAFLRARRLDAHFERRRALRQLNKLTKHLASSKALPTPVDLERWCELTAQIVSIRRAAPVAEEMIRAFAQTAEITDKTAWHHLWHEAREALFSGRREAPGDWTKRARSAAAQTIIKRASPAFPILRTHWFPRVAALVLCASFALASGKLRAATAEELYRDRKFEEAQTSWTDYLQTHPRDWAAHNNVALAAVQQAKWGLAQAHWTAAYLLAPRNAVVRENLKMALDRVDRVDPVLRKALEGTRAEQAMGFLSPGEWQEISWIALFMAGGGLCLVIGGRYTRRLWLRLGAFVAILGMVGLAVSIYAVRSYGLLAQPNAACLTRQTDLRSIPSDLVEIQATAPLLAGTLLTTDGYYFGWSRIVGRGNVIGWVRRDAVLSLYTALDTNGASGFARVPLPPKNFPKVK